MLQSLVGDHGEEKDQSISVDQGVWLKLRPDEPSEEEYICFDAYVGDALPDPGLPDLKLQRCGHRPHLI